MDRISEPQRSGALVLSGVHFAGLQLVGIGFPPGDIGAEDEFREPHPPGKLVGRGGDEALREWKDGGCVHEATRDRMEPVGGGERNLHPEAEELTDPAGVDHHVPGRRRSERSGQSGELLPFVRGSRRIRWIQQQHGLPARLDVRGEGRGLGRQEIEAGTRDDHHGRILGNPDLAVLDVLEQRQLRNLVVGLLEPRPDGGEAAGARLFERPLLVPGREVDLLRLALEDLDDGVRDVLLLGRRDAFLPFAALHDHRAEGNAGFGGRLVGPRAGGFGLLVDDLPGDPVAPVGVALEEFDGASGGARLIEHHEPDVAVEFLENADRLWRQAELASGREVPGDVAPVRHVVDAHQDTEEQERRDSEVRPLPGAPASQHRAQSPESDAHPRHLRERTDSRARKSQNAANDR